MSSCYSVAARHGCAWNGGDFREHPSRPGVLMLLFSNEDRSRWLWVGYDEKRGCYVIHRGKELK